MSENLPTTTEERKPPTLRERIERAGPEFARALPGHIPPERFIRSVQTAVSMNPDIARAATHSPGAMQSLMLACTKAATDGLILDGREAALVTFRQKVSKNPDVWEDRLQYIPMVAGLMKKARNSGEIVSITAEIVYAKDLFKSLKGDDAKIIHEPYDGEEPAGPATHVYSIVRMKSGEVQREVMNRAQVMRIAAQSKNPDQYDPTKGKNYEEWWRKTVIRRISKYLPSSSDRDDFQAAVSRIDDAFDFDDTEAEHRAPQPAHKRRGGAADALKNITPTEKVKPADEPTERQEGGDEIIDGDTGEIIDTDDTRQTYDDI